MDSKPLVSVIIPNYNHALFLKQRLDSVLNQTFQDFEVIILDDYSTDKSREIIETYRNHPKIKKIVYNETNSGSVFKQWKKGVELATGKYVWIAESDDSADINLLKELIEVAEFDNRIGICFSGSHWIDDNNLIKDDWTVYKEDFIKPGYEEIKKNLFKYNSIPNASAAIMKNFLVKKYIDSIVNYKWCGDWFLYVQILHESDMAHVVKKLNSFRFYHNNSSSKFSKEGLALYEGIEILRFMDFNKIKFKFSDVIKISNTWVNKIKTAGNVKNKGKLYAQIFNFNIKYLKSKFSAPGNISK